MRRLDSEAALARLAALSSHSAPQETALDGLQRAAAVLLSFDPQAIAPPGGEPAPATPRLLKESDPVDGGRWALRDGARLDALRALLESGGVEEALDANPGDGSTGQEIMSRWLRGLGVDWEEMDASPLRAAVRVHRWLDGLPGLELPTRDALEGKLRQAALLEPLHQITAGFFDREALRAQLLAHVDGPGQEPLVLHGLGGVGKSALVARFLLDVIERPEPPAWVYLDLDSAAIDPGDVNTLTLELVRQLGDQASGERWRARNALRIRPRRPLKTVKRDPTRPDRLQEFVGFIQSAVDERRLVLVLDTFEEAQYLGVETTAEILRFLQRLQSILPSLRAVLSGRKEEPGLPALEVSGFEPDVAETFLASRLENPPPPGAMGPIVERMGTLPLTLLLAAEVLNRAPASASLDLSENEGLTGSLRDQHAQGFLYTRVLDHLHGGDRLKRLAHASLALPAVSAPVIREVLAPACDLHLTPPADEDALLEALGREISFVEALHSESGAWLRHRPDLRRLLRPALRQSLAQRGMDLDEILSRAAAWRDQRRVAEDLEPEILALFSQLDQGDTRGDGAESEPTRGEVYERAEAAALALITSMLQEGRSADALALLAERELAPGSPLRLLEAQALAEEGHPLEAAAAAEHSLGEALTAALPNPAMRAALFIGDLPDLPPWRGLAAIRAALYSRAVDAPLDRLHLRTREHALLVEANGPLGPTRAALDALLEDLGPRDRAERPELVVALAGQLGAERPELLREALEEPGLGELTDDRIEALARGLSAWDDARGGAIARAVALEEYAELEGVAPAESWESLVAYQRSDLSQTLLDLLDRHPPDDAILQTLQDLFAGAFDEPLPADPDPIDASSAPLDLSTLEISLPLTVQQRRAFHGLLIYSFDTPELEIWTRSISERLWSTVSWRTSLSRAAFELLAAAERTGLVEELALAFIEERPQLGRELAEILTSRAEPPEEVPELVPEPALSENAKQRIALYQLLIHNFDSRSLEHLTRELSIALWSQVPWRLSFAEATAELLNQTKAHGELDSLIEAIQAKRPDLADQLAEIFPSLLENS